MSATAEIWRCPGTVAVGFAAAARDSARVAAVELRDVEAGRGLAQAKVFLEEAAVVAGAELAPRFGLRDIEFYLRDESSLPELIPVTSRQIKVLAGSDPLSSAYARTELAGRAFRKFLDTRYQAEREEAFAEYREHELQPPDLGVLELLFDAQVDLGRALDEAVVAEIVSITAQLGTERSGRGVLRLMAA